MEKSYFILFIKRKTFSIVFVASSSIAKRQSQTLEILDWSQTNLKLDASRETAFGILETLQHINNN